MMSNSDFFDELETMSLETRKEYLDQRLSQTIDYAYRNAPAAKAILDRAGITPADIQTVKDLEKLPGIGTQLAANMKQQARKKRQ